MDKMILDIAYLERCISTLEKAHKLLLIANPESIDYDMFRSACVKEFEIILELSGKLLRKKLKPYLHSSKAVDQLYFKDVFRQAVVRSIITSDVCERFLQYRDNRDNTALDYGINFAEETLLLLPNFIADAKILLDVLNQPQDDHQE